MSSLYNKAITILYVYYRRKNADLPRDDTVVIEDESNNAAPMDVDFAPVASSDVFATPVDTAPPK